MCVYTCKIGLIERESRVIESLAWHQSNRLSLLFYTSPAVRYSLKIKKEKKMEKKKKKKPSERVRPRFRNVSAVAEEVGRSQESAHYKARHHAFIDRFLSICVGPDYIIRCCFGRGGQKMSNSSVYRSTTSYLLDPYKQKTKVYQSILLKIRRR
jgi:hypothetical protein